MDKNLIGKRIKSRRAELEMTQGDIADAIGVAISTVQRYEAGTIEKIKLPVIEAIARALRVSPAWLVGKSEASVPETPSAPELVTFPVLADTPAGPPGGDTVTLPRSYLEGRAPSDYFVLAVQGDAMYPLYQDGDRVLILRQSTLDHSGDVAVVRSDGGQPVLRRVDYVAGKDWMRLVPVNPAFPVHTLESAALEQCCILGLPRLLLREIR